MTSLLTIFLLFHLFNSIQAVDQMIDLNQPASPAEDWPTAEMLRVSYIRKVTAKEGIIV
jgi:hypothetical protein